MRSANHKPGICRFCRYPDEHCKLPDGEMCSWYLATRDVCTAPACITAYHAELDRKMAQSSRATRKRTPGQIHQLIKQEKNAKQRAYRAKRKQQAGTHRWECECGDSGWYAPIDLSLAGLVRAARSLHNCPDPDIVRVESRTEYGRRQIAERIVGGAA